MRATMISRRRALALVLMPAAAWLLRVWPAAAQEQPEYPPWLRSESNLDKLTPPGEPDPPPGQGPDGAPLTDAPPAGEQPVQLETKVTTETPVGAQQENKSEASERPKEPETYVRKKVERQKQERVKAERKAAVRKKTERSASDRTMRRNY